LLSAALGACSGLSGPDAPLPGQPVEFTLRAGEDVWVGGAVLRIDTLNTSLEPRTASVGDFTITLLDVIPYPESSTLILPEEYAVRIRVEA
jgi:hypothetical protein